MTSEAARPDGAVIKEMGPRELKERLDQGDPLLLVDVREPFEKLLADLPDHGQVNIPVREIPFVGGTLDHDRDMVLYCRSGPRSAWATERLAEMGYSRAFNLKGGILAWREQVDPTIQGY